VKSAFIGTAHIVFRAVYMKRYGVRLSVRPIHPVQQCVMGLLLWARQSIGEVTEGSATLLAYVGSWTDFFLVIVPLHKP